MISKQLKQKKVVILSRALFKLKTLDTRQRLTDAFKHFPGIGPRQARRFVYFLLSKGPKFAGELAKEINKLHKNTTRCEITHYYFQQKHGNETKSEIAQDPDRDWSRLLLVETSMDLEAIERTGEYNGMYFVLGSHGSLMTDNLDSSLPFSELKDIITTHYKDELTEVIIATSVTPEGERVRDVTERQLSEFADKFNFKISTLGRGLSTGTELEYIDDHTLKHALAGRN